MKKKSKKSKKTAAPKANTTKTPKKAKSLKKEFLPLGRKTHRATRKDLENLNRNTSASEDHISLEKKEKEVREGVHEDTQRPLGA